MTTTSSTPLLQQPTQTQISSGLGQTMQVIQTALPDYDIEWMHDPVSHTAVGHLHRGNLCCLFCFGAFAQCFCMYAKWEVYLVENGRQILVSLGKSDNSIFVTCLLGGAIGAAITADEYKRVQRIITNTVALRANESQFEVTDVSPPTYESSTARPPPAYLEAINTVKQPSATNTTH
eukprot:m.137000 g.137000  ORF g.137000 m.137000 type:complete len:177 (+) comp11149_c0_seq1:29-559(+)